MERLTEFSPQIEFLPSLNHIPRVRQCRCGSFLTFEEYENQHMHFDDSPILVLHEASKYLVIKAVVEEKKKCACAELNLSEWQGNQLLLAYKLKEMRLSDMETETENQNRQSLKKRKNGSISKYLMMLLFLRCFCLILVLIDYKIGGTIIF